jgi:hypothetical protein
MMFNAFHLEKLSILSIKVKKIDKYKIFCIIVVSVLSYILPK